ncbi:hypothetical protein CLOL250_02136 [Clostridium sp. L2-50]|nr:hypothetical protein CLOL250_02136 [Clostridium sp. L2-50]
MTICQNLSISARWKNCLLRYGIENMFYCRNKLHILF